MSQVAIMDSEVRRTGEGSNQLTLSERNRRSMVKSTLGRSPKISSKILGASLGVSTLPII